MYNPIALADLYRDSIRTETIDARRAIASGQPLKTALTPQLLTNGKDGAADRHRLGYVRAG